MLKRLNNEDVVNLYNNHIEHDFPKSERQPCSSLLESIEAGVQDALIYLENGVEMAYCIVAKIGEYFLIPLLAVFEEYRGCGIGSKMIAELKEYYTCNLGVIVEVEKPENAENDAERRLRERRISFYERAGFMIFRDIDYCIWGIPFYLMVYGKKKMPVAEELVNQMKMIYGKLLHSEHQDKLKISVL